LIHEATLEDAELDKAIAKRHTTTGEAVEVGKK
jgi:ribonuclease Z